MFFVRASSSPNSICILFVAGIVLFASLSLKTVAVDAATGDKRGQQLNTVFTGPTVPDAPVDFNGDGRSDYVLVRNTGGGTPDSQMTWFYRLSSDFTPVQLNWGLGRDFYLAEDFDNDNKDDIAVWRGGAPGVASFYILNSATSTIRVEGFGQTGDDPTVVDDYNNDGAVDLAVYRDGANPGDPSVWYYRTSQGGPVNFVLWGTSGDFPAPGDYDGDGKADFVVQRTEAGGAARFWRLMSGGTSDNFQFGLGTDYIAPGDYDDDGKTDVCVVRVNDSDVLEWYVEPSATAGISYIQVNFGNDVTDFAAQADYDGNGATEISIWRNSGSFWSFSLQTGAVSVFPMGLNGDYPVANANVH